MIYKVSDLNKVVKNYLEGNLDFRDIAVEGEVSNITYHSSGHLYFTIKDKLSCLKCAIFSYAYKNVALDVKAGDAVRVAGRVTLYAATGQYQMVCDALSKKGKEGDLYEKFQLLKEKLRNKGYFRDEIKKSIPLCFKIGVVTSDKGAVIRDIVTTAKRKFENIDITLFPAKVQGEGSDLEIIKGIEYLSNRADIDVIIIGRGGGSFEDLNCFNSELLAETIFKCEKPIVSAVGHETDFVISDMVADLRAATPTQAAEIVTPDMKALKEMLAHKGNILSNILMNSVESMRSELALRAHSYAFKSLPDEIGNGRLLLEQHSTGLNRIMASLLSENRNRLENAKERTSYFLKRELEIKKNNFLSKISLIKILNPLGIIERGFSTTQNKEGKIISSVKEVKVKDLMVTRLGDGKVKSEVVKID